MPAVSFAKKAPSAAPAPAPVIEVAATPVTPTAPAPAPAPQATPEVTPQATPEVTGQVAGQVTGQVAPSPSVPAVTQKFQTPASSGKLLLGDFLPSFADIIMPRLNIAQQIGELKNSFDPGTIVFNMTTALFTGPVIDAKTNTIATPATPPVTVVCLGFRPTRFVEKVPGGGRGMIVSSEEAVRDNGGTLDYSEHKLKEKDGMKRFEQLAEALFAIERPAHIADDDNIFVYPIEGKKYALAIYGMKGMSYTVAKAVLFTNRRMGCLRQGYPTRIFSLTSRWKPTEGGHGAWIPVLIPGATTSPEFISWVASVLDPDEAAPEGQ